MECMIHILLLFVCFCCSVLLWLRLKKSGKVLPPGPLGLPLIGNVHQIGDRPHLRFMQWAKDFGSIFRLRLVHIETVVISDHKIMRELFSYTAASGRMLDNPVIYEFTKGNYGIVNGEGNNWKHQRRLILQILRNFGFGKSVMESLIIDETRTLINWFRKSNGKPIPATRTFTASVVNSLWNMVCGDRFKWEDEEGRLEFLEAADRFLETSMEVTSKGLLFFPILRYIAPTWSGWNRYLKAVKDITNLLKEIVQKHEKTFNANNLRDLVDCYLHEIYNMPPSEKEHGYKNLVAGLLDLFVAGSEDTSNTFSWALLLLSGNHKVQEKMYDEISEVLCTRYPTLSDRPNMPYTEAVIAEILRISSVLATSVPHRMQEDLLFHGFYLQKGTSVFANIYAMHYNPKVWGDPNNFRPERFLNKEGTKFIKHDGLVGFGEGKRKCIGETMAKDILFIFLTSILQEFHILPEDDKPLDMEPDLGYFLIPKPFNVIMSPRK